MSSCGQRLAPDATRVGARRRTGQQSEGPRILVKEQEVKTIVLLDFPETPTPEDWTIEGYAFGTRNPVPEERQKAAVPSRNQMHYKSGKMTSPEFVIDTNYVKVICAGVFHPTLCTVRLVVDGEDVRSCSPEPSYGFHGWDLNSPDARLFAPPTPIEYWFDLRPLKRKKATIEIRDNHNNGYFARVKIALTDSTPPDNTKLVTDVASWLPDYFETTIQGDYLLLPVGHLAGTPLQPVTVELDDRKILVVDQPLAFGSIPVAGYIPLYDLTGHQGKKLKVSFHSFQGDESAKVLLQSEIPGREISDKKPAFHVNNRIGTLSDPNGLFYLNGVYHLYHQYQYNITGSSWAHYTSTDLMHWEERPITLFHDTLGSMHSGSGAVDVMNTSGWQTGDLPPVISAYTASRGNGGSDKIQMQGIAYSVDGGKTFTKYEGNPVVGESQIFTEGSDNARDPKIFWFSPTQGLNPYAKDGYWVMVLFEGDSLSIYSSNNLKDWEKHSSIQGFHECPELFPLTIDGDPKNIRWIMYGGNGEYHIGVFDGKNFTPETKEKIPLNYGKFYAAQTFNNTKIGIDGQARRVQVGWQGERQGHISMPTELTLRTTPLGLRVCMLPVKELANLHTRSEKLNGMTLSPGDANPLATLKGGLYDIEIESDLSAAKQVVLDVRGQKLVFDVARDGLLFGELKIPDTKTLVLRIVVDNTSTDVFFGEHGLYHSPGLTQPTSKNLSLEVHGGDATFAKLQVHELKSIW